MFYKLLLDKALLTEITFFSMGQHHTVDTKKGQQLLDWQTHGVHKQSAIILRNCTVEKHEEIQPNTCLEHSTLWSLP